MRLTIWCFWALLFVTLHTYAQQDSISLPKNADSTIRYRPRPAAGSLLDSVAKAMKARQQFVSDSLSMVYIRTPNPNRPNRFLDSMMKTYLYKGYGFLDIKYRTNNVLKEGIPRKSRDRWVVGIIAGLILYIAILNRLVGKDILNVLQSFYSKRVLSQVTKEESLLNSWSFLGLYLLFGLTFGLFIYQLASYYDVFYRISGFQLFISLSFLIVVLFALKLLALKFLGFIFDINKLVSEYMSILYLTYFNITFVFLPVSVCFSLLSAKYLPYILTIAFILVIIIFIWQYLRSSVNIISSFRFHKFYLFLYLCALEICPILILIKALNI